MDEPRTEQFRPQEGESGSIHHESLPHDFRTQIEAVYRLIGRYLGQTLEEFEASFRCAEELIDEVAQWCRIAAAWYEYHEKYLGDERLTDEQEEKLVAALMAISGGEADLHKLPVVADVGALLMKLYSTGRTA